MSAVATFANLSPPAKAGLAAGGGVGVVGLLSALVYSPMLAAILAAGVAVIALVLVVYRLVLKLLDKRKASPMLKALSGNSAAAPKGVSDPARRARLDDLRRVFDGGMGKFHDAGKNIYSVPWYILVGEPGSGKTEAIRHCNVGFPPGLQDELQGVGGTINMNWWFTNHAVILDTAGRLMFEEVEPGTTSEWQEFLKLLRRNRPNCPINGMLLVIPAESLIKDSADAIGKKAGKIAQQLDQIQRALGVRFPVYLVVTKCDLINGFREFFDEITDPALQHQILGWSNPAPLDAPFNPELMDQHLKSVHERLVRRRLGLLLDPVNTEDASKRRTDQVDALFAFPDSLLKIAPRLRRYLEMIFVAGEWSAKPLFLRGIYFTSSMREGGALDAELAEVFGIALESLPEGRVWERERAFFLRDLFMSKVFRERGLVTRASNTSKQQARRRLAVYGTAAVGGTLVLAFTLLGWTQLSARVVEPVAFWSSVAEAYSGEGGEAEYLLPIVSGGSPTADEVTYIGVRKVDGVPIWPGGVLPEDAEPTQATVPVLVAAAAETKIRIPGIFRPIAALFGDTPSDLSADRRREAAAAILETAVIRPLVDRAVARVRADAAPTPEAAEALVQLLRLEVGRLSANPSPRAVELLPLAKYVLGEACAPDQPAAADLELLDGKAHQWVYAPGKGDQPFRVEGAADDDAKTVAQGLKRLAEAWAAGKGGASPLLLQVEDAAAKLGQLLEAERQLQGTTVLKDWPARLKTVRDAASAATASVEAMKGRKLAEAYGEASKQALEEGEKLVARLRGEVVGQVVADPAAPGAAGGAKAGGAGGVLKPAKGDEARWEQLQAACKSIDDLVATLKSRRDGAQQRRTELAALDALQLQAVDGKPAYLMRLAMYDIGDKLVTPPTPLPSGLTPAVAGTGLAIGTVGKKLSELEQLAAESGKQLDATKALFGDEKQLALPVKERLDGAARVSRFAIQAGSAEQAQSLVQQWVASLPADQREVQAAVERFARETAVPSPKVPLLPLTRWQEPGGGGAAFDLRFNPAAGAALLLDCQQVLRRNAPPSAGVPDAGGDLKPAERQKVQQVYAGYATAYLEYWTTQMRASTAFAAPSWKAAVERLQAVPQTVVFDEALAALADAIDGALAQVEAVGPKDLSAQLSPAELRAQVKTARESIAARSKNFSDVMGAWRRLSGDAQLDRDTVIAERNFGDTYVPVLVPERTGQLLGDFVSEYRLKLALGLLHALAEDYLGAVRAAANRLQASEKFPLVAPARTGGRVAPVVEQITPEEAVVLRGQLRGLLGQPGAAGGGAGAGRGGAPWDADLARLRDPLVELAVDRERLNLMLSILRELPAGAGGGGGPRECKVTVVDAAGAGEQAASFFYPVAAVVQGPAPQPPAAGQNYRNGSTAPRNVTWPGPPVAVYFYQFGQGDAHILVPNQTIDDAGPWAALLLLFEGKATPVAGNNKAWDVKVEMSAEGQLCYVTLRLEFDAVLPDPATWPKRQ